MVSYSYDEALRKLAPCDSPFDWDRRDSPHPDVAPPEDDEE